MTAGWHREGVLGMELRGWRAALQTHWIIFMRIHYLIGILLI